MHHHTTHHTRHIRLLLTGLTATIILAAAVGTANARELALSNNAFRVIWTSLELSNNIPQKPSDARSRSKAASTAEPSPRSSEG